MLNEGEVGSEQFELEQLRTTTSSTSLLHSSSTTSANNNTFHYIPLIHPPPPNNNFNSHPSTSNSQFQTQTNFFPPSILLPHHSPKHNNYHNFNFQIQTPPPPFIDSTWTNHELLALFKITSTIHNFFPDQLITWDHVSRKLAEIGINKSAEKCKDTFEDDNISSLFKIHNNHNNDNYSQFISELQDLYQGGVGVDEQQNSDEKGNIQEENSRDDDNDTDIVVVTKQCDDDDEDKVMEKSKRKRKRRNRFEMLKSFCEKVVNKMMTQQEEIHNKLLEDMLKRDKEKVAREEEWKNQEIERMNMMAQEQAIASNRQSTIIDFLNKYLSIDGNGKGCSSSQNPNDIQPCNNILEVESTPSCSNVIAQLQAQQNPSSSETVIESNYTSTLVVPTIIMEKLEDRRRWPRDEVLALINLKSTTSVITRSNNVEEKEGNSNIKGPLWERISEGMLEMGYKRSAKRCKEKWENINKYFKKTKDVANKKKRSLDSRTCPYFHQLSSLYNNQQEGKLIIQSQSQLVTNPISNSADQVDDQPQAHSPVGSKNDAAC
ncbi:hypothetical protein P8452_63256 [Trifolium repens]|nr:hypothetical protein P8452_63256 [Trifolium repens]